MRKFAVLPHTNRQLSETFHLPCFLHSLCRRYFYLLFIIGSVFRFVKCFFVGTIRQEKKNLRRLRILVTAQTAWHLEELRKICGYREAGHVVDKLVREKLLSLRSGRGK